MSHCNSGNATDIHSSLRTINGEESANTNRRLHGGAGAGTEGRPHISSNTDVTRMVIGHPVSIMNSTSVTSAHPVRNQGTPVPTSPTTIVSSSADDLFRLVGGRATPLDNTSHSPLFLHGCHTSGDITIRVGRGRHTGGDSLNTVGRGRHTDGDDSSKFGRGCHTYGDDSSKVGRGRHTGGDISSKVGRGCHTPTVTTPARSAEDATPTVTTPARLTVNPAIVEVVVKATHDFGPTMVTSFTESSSSDVICQTKGGVFLMMSIAPANQWVPGSRRS